MLARSVGLLFFFFNDTATTEIYTLSLHDALPISAFRKLYGQAYLDLVNKAPHVLGYFYDLMDQPRTCGALLTRSDRKSTRLNSSHQIISYAVFCLKKKKD